MEELLKLVKQCLSIVETATLKDKEIEMLIQAGIADLKRQGIVASETTTRQSSTICYCYVCKSKFR